MINPPIYFFWGWYSPYYNCTVIMGFEKCLTLPILPPKYWYTNTNIGGLKG